MTSQILYLGISVLTVALGVFGSITVGFLDNNETFVDGVTKASIGIAVMFAGFLNVALIRSGGDLVIRLLCCFSNALLAALFGIGGYLNSQSPLPYVWMTLLLCAAALSASFRRERTDRLD